MSEDSEKRENRRRVRRWYESLLRDTPADFTPLEAVIAVKCLDGSGEVCLFTHKTPGLSYWEAFGMAAVLSGDFDPVAINAATEDDE